jgi:hypothetical protein
MGSPVITGWQGMDAHLLLYFQRDLRPVPGFPVLWRDVTVCAAVVITLIDGLGEEVGELKVHQLDLHICSMQRGREGEIS